MFLEKKSIKLDFSPNRFRNFVIVRYVYLKIKRNFPKSTLAVFIKPPSIDELKIRLKKRQTESKDKINMRVAKASAELATAPLFDCIIENNVLDTALKEAYDNVSNFLN